MLTAADLPQCLYSVYGDDEDLSEMVDIFVEEIPQRVSTLRAYWDGEDLDGLKRTAHQLKGAGGSYGFSTLSQFAAQVEYAVRDSESRDAIAAKLNSLLEVCQRLRTGVAP